MAKAKDVELWKANMKLYCYWLIMIGMLIMCIAMKIICANIIAVLSAQRGEKEG